MSVSLITSSRSVLSRSCLTLLLVSVVLRPALAQTGPSGAVSGRVVDPSGLPLVGVAVTVKGPAAGDVRQGMTGPDGTYILRSLPPAEYTVTFDLNGFRPQQHLVRVAAPGTAVLNVELALAAIPATVTVTTAPERNDPEQTTPEGLVLRPASLDLLPLKGPEAARITMAAGVTANGPGGAITMSGALSYGNLFLLDGLVINENLRGQARSFLIQDAMQETRIATAGVPAEYGRFQGGVVNTITKSGTNAFGGSVRVTFNNDSWRALTPFQGDRTVNRRAPALQMTFGGPARKNRLWFFTALLFDRVEQNRTLPYTRLNYTARDREWRFEGKLTWAVTPRQVAKLAYYRVDSHRNHASTGVVMDLASLYDSRSPEALLGATYTAVLGPQLFLEAQYSNRQLTFKDVGSRDTTLEHGTPIWDRSRSDARFSSPTGCAVCEGSADERDNQNVFVKIFRAVQTEKAGVHELAAGFDAFQESRRNNSYQSGSGFRVRATRSTIVGTQVFPVFLPDRTTWIYWVPILRDASGNDLRTYSGFIADTWRLTRSLTAKLGLRYDRHSDWDSLGARVAGNDEVSPRVGLVWDLRGNGRLLLNAGVARYVTSITSNIADAASSGGRPATYVYDYLGPAVNADPKAPPLTSADALKVLFDWFNATGGTNRSPRSAPSIPGVTSRIDPGVKPPDAREVTIGVTCALGRAGSLRVDGIYRTFGGFYANRRDMATGRTTDASGRQYDLLIVTNTNEVSRVYRGVNAQFSAALTPRLRTSAAYTLSWGRGNYDGETANVGPDTAAYTDYPEYRDPRWNSPYGWLAIDQRHKLRVTASWDLPLAPSLGRFTLGAVQRVDSGRPWSAIGNINPTAYVANPGYLTPPTSVAYYFSARGAYRTATIASTDLSLNWYRRLPRTKKAQAFCRLFLANAFNRAGIVNVARNVLTRTDSTVYQPFNPFKDQPVSGVHYGFGASFGKPTTPGDYQAPREFTFSVGLRF